MHECLRWKLWPRQATGDKKYGTEENIVAIESQHIRAYIPLPDHDHRTEFFRADGLILSFVWSNEGRKLSLIERNRKEKDKDVLVTVQ